MKKSLLLVLALALTIILASNVLADSINLPTAVMQGQSFRVLPGEMDCSGGPCNITWTSPSGADDGSKWELGANPDPDTALDGWYLFNEAGTYTVSIYSCPGGVCNATPDNTYTVEVLDPATIDGEISAGYYFETQTDWLQVAGYAQANAQSARVVWQGDDGSRITGCAGVTQGNNPEFSYSWANVTGTWTHQSYMLFVNFFQGTGCTGLDSYPFYWGGDFDLLQIREILIDVDQLEVDLNATNATLQATIVALENLTSNVSALEAQAADLQAQIDNITADIATINAVIINMTTNISALETNVANLQSDLALLTADVNNLWDVVDAMNHGTINLYHYLNETEGLNLLNVWGEAPIGASNAHLWIYRLDQIPFMDTPVYSSITPVVTYSNGNAYYFTAFTGNPVDLNDSEFGPEKYNVFVVFEPLSPDYAVSALFDDLLIMDLADRVNQTEQDLIWLNDTVHYMNESLWNETREIRDILDIMNSATLNVKFYDTPSPSLRVHGEAPLGATGARLCIVDASLPPPQQNCGNADVNLWTSITDLGANGNVYLFSGVDVSTLDPTQQYNIMVRFDGIAPYYTVIETFNALLVGNLEERVLTLEEQIALLNQGDLDLVWDQDDDRLRAKIKFPLGATKARLMAYDENDELYETYGVVTPQSDNFRNVDWYGLLSWDPQVYTIKVKFMDDNNSQVERWVTEVFYGVYLYHIDTTLYGDPMACADLGLPADIYNYLPQEDTLWWVIEMLAGYTGGDMTYGEVCDFAEWGVDYFTDGNGDEIIGEIPLEFADEIHTMLRCLGYDDELHLNTLWNLCQQQDIDALEQFTHGFNFVDSKTFETFRFEDDFVRPITFGLNPKYDEEYEVHLIQGWSNNPGGYDISQQLTSCTWMQQDQWNSRIRPMHLEQTWPVATEGEGRYRVWLEAYPCSGNPVAPYYVSNKFNIRVDDLADPWPQYTVQDVGVIPGDLQYAEGVYWTSSTLVNFIGLYANATSWLQNESELWNYKPSEQYIVSGKSFDEGMPFQATWDINLSEYLIYDGSTTAPVYKFRFCGDPINFQVDCNNATFYVGYDVTPPSINVIYPGERDKLSGTTTFKVDVTDDGVIKYVNITLVNKTNANQTWNYGLATYNSTSGLYELDVDTTLVPDGWYNISVNAVDFAGNFANGVLDPMIDNTPPEVLSVMMYGFVGEQGGFTVESAISDNLAGVASAYALLYPYTDCDDDFDAGDCSLSWCEPRNVTNETCENVTVYQQPAYDECMAGCVGPTGDVAMQISCEGACEANYASTVENCTNVTTELEPDCNNTAACSDDLAAQDCVNSCDGNETCIESCYLTWCYDYQFANEPFDEEVMCEENCYATWTCGNVSNTSVLNVPLNLTEGDVLEGLWTGEANGSALDDDQHYLVVVHAFDDATPPNENNGSNQDATAYQFYSHMGYTVTVEASEEEVYTNEDFDVRGTVVAYDGAPVSTAAVLDEYVDLFPWTRAYEILAGIFAANDVDLDSAGERTITARYTPLQGCSDEWYFEGSTTINVVRAPKSSGGGGGGYYDGGATECDDGYERNDDGDCVKIEEEPEPEETGSDGSSQPVTSGASENPQGSAPEEPKEPEEPTDDNLVTGAVTGGGFGGWAWTGIAVGLIALLLVAYLIVRRR